MHNDPHEGAGKWWPFGVKKLFEKEGKDLTDNALDAAIGRIETITADASDPGACNIVEFLHEGDTFGSMMSKR